MRAREQRPCTCVVSLSLSSCLDDPLISFHVTPGRLELGLYHQTQQRKLAGDVSLARSPSRARPAPVHNTRANPPEDQTSSPAHRNHCTVEVRPPRFDVQNGTGGPRAPGAKQRPLHEVIGRGRPAGSPGGEDVCSVGCCRARSVRRV